MKIERINCIYHTDFGKCNHLDMRRGLFGFGKQCVMHDDFVGSCSKMIKHKPMVLPKVTPPPCDDEPQPRSNQKY